MSHATRIKRDQRRERRARVRALLQPKLPAPLLSVWQDACYVWSTFCWLFETPAQLARREALSRVEHRERNDWIHHLERLVRQLVLVAALALNLILGPSASQTRKPRQRRLRLAWPDRPASWRGSRNRTLAPMRHVRSRCARGTRQQNVRDRAAA